VRLFAGIFALLFLPYCWNKPRYGMILLVALQVIFLGGSLQVTSEKVIYGAFFGVLMLAWLPGLLRTRRAWIKPGMTKWLLVLFVFFLISRAIGEEHGIPAVDWFRDLSPMLNYLWIFLGVYALAPHVDTRKYAVSLLTFIAILTVPITLQWMYYRSFLSSAPDLLDNTTLGPGITMFGAFLSIALVLDAKDKRTKRKFVYLTLGFFAAAFLSGTRVVVASIVAGLFAYFLLLRREHKVSFRSAISGSIWVTGGLLVLVVTLAATKVIDVSGMIDRYTETTTSEMMEDDTIKDRIIETVDGWNAFMQSPLVGQGLGYRTETVYTVGEVEFQPESFFMHNFYIYLLSKFGIVGSIIFLAFLISILRHAIKGYFRRLDGFDKYYFGSMAALMIALLLMSITAAAFIDRLETALLGIMVGTMIGMDQRKSESRDATVLAISG
jgi:O-antigen ligase